MATSAPREWLRNSRAAGWQRTVRDALRYVPQGDTIPEESWRARHRGIVALLTLHVPLLFAIGRFDGTESLVTGATLTAKPLEHVVVGLGAILALAALAMVPRLGRRLRTGIASIGLMTATALLVYFSGGFIEAHFHFFVMVGVIALYEDWLPFVVSILYVAVQHGVFGMTHPEAVYNHPAAIANPMGWALVHATFVLGLSGALLVNWVSIERSREETRTQMQNVKESNVARAEAEEAKSMAEERRQEVERLNERLLVHAGAIADAMETVAEGDFTAETPQDVDIEAIAEISDAFEEMKGELSETVLDLREFAGTVETTTRSVYDDAESMERTQQELADDIREFADDLREQAEGLESTTGDLSTLSATIEEIAANAEEVSNQASNAADAADDGAGTAEEAIEAIETVEASVDELATLVESLDSRMDDVAESTDLIEDIAEQTNMLALNANIEAARATDGSDGFAVVADEVKSLADETRDHSAAIERTIARTIEDVDRVQAEMERTKSELRTGEATMVAAGDTFGGLAETVDEVDASVDEVAAATDDGARTTEEVVDAISRVAERSRTVADRSESLADRAERGATTISTICAQLDDLTSQTASLQDQLDEFAFEQSVVDAETRSPESIAD
jgi:methyl-accepting chemotaxis protein